MFSQATQTINSIQILDIKYDLYTSKISFKIKAKLYKSF
jgi:hypothetical protein